MPGFAVSNFCSDFELDNAYPQCCLREELAHPVYTVMRHTLGKFLNDKPFCETARHILIIDGVVLNKKDLMAKYGGADFAATVEAMALEKPDFFAAFRGSFSGAVLDKAADRWTFFTNHTGEKALFYYHDVATGRFMVGSQPNYLLNALRKAGVALHPDEKACLDMLTFSFMERDNTYAREVHRLLPGRWMTIDQSGLCVSDYYRLGYGKQDLAGIGMDEAVGRLDELFCDAVRMEYEKDAEYGYRHVSGLSGGMDARMACWIAREQGFGPITNITFGRRGCLDDKLAGKLARQMGSRYVFISMEDADVMLDVEGVTRLNYGLANYGLAGGARRSSQLLDGWRYGLSHNGMLGDVVIGSYLAGADEAEKPGIAGAASRKLIAMADTGYRETFKYRELYQFEVRGLLGMMASSFVVQNVNECASPFINPDLLDFCFSLPLAWRIGHKLYRQWVLKKYPGAAKLRWENSNLNFKWGPRVSHLGMLVTHYPYQALNALGHPINRGMMPYGYWYKTKPEISQFYTDYFKKHIGHPALAPELRATASTLFKKGYVQEKGQVLTLLAALEYYFPQ